MFSAAILGCAGYTGQETLDRLLAHPELEPVALGSDSLAGRPASALDPRLERRRCPTSSRTPRRPPRGAERALPVPRARGGGGVRAARRRRRRRPLGCAQAPSTRTRRGRGTARRPAPGATAFPSSGRRSGPLIANPGCYATAALLALGPLARGLESAIVDAKSGVSGAGRTLRDSSHAGAVLENLAPYAIGEHRHAPEIAEQLGFDVCFVPHLLPVRRGLLATCYVRFPGDAREALEEAYGSSPVVRRARRRA